MPKYYVVDNAPTYPGPVPEGYALHSAGGLWLGNGDLVLLSNTLSGNVDLYPDTTLTQNGVAPAVSLESGTHGAYRVTAHGAQAQKLTLRVEVPQGVTAPDVTVNLGQTDGGDVSVGANAAIGNITGSINTTGTTRITLAPGAASNSIVTTGPSVFDIAPGATVAGQVWTGALNGAHIVALPDEGAPGGNTAPDHDLLLIHDDTPHKGAFQQALMDQRLTPEPLPYGMGARSGPNTTFTWDGVTYHQMDWLNKMPCFARGTLIAVNETEVAPIEDLAYGQTVLTVDRGPQPLRWAGGRKVSQTELAQNPKLQPVRIRAGALGGGLPKRDLIVSPQHRILINTPIAQRMFDAENGILAPARQLCQIEGIDLADDLKEVEYFHLLLPRHEIIFAEGVMTESLYTGPMAQQAMGSDALSELITILPGIAFDGQTEPARPLLSGRMARKLAVRHTAKHKPLVE